MRRYAVYGTKDSVYIVASDLLMALTVYVNQYQSIFGEPVRAGLEPQ